MSKKRKKLRKALKALGAGLAIAGLGRAFMNRNRTGTEFPRPKAGTIDQMAKDMTVATPKVYDDPIMTGGKGVKQGFKTTSANVQKGLVDPPGLFNKGVVKFDKPISIIPKKKFKGSAQIMRERATAKADARRNDMLRAIRGDVPVQQVDPITDFDQTQDFGFGVMAKDGGRIVKGEKKAVRPKKITKKSS